MEILITMDGDMVMETLITMDGAMVMETHIIMDGVMDMERLIMVMVGIMETLITVDIMEMGISEAVDTEMGISEMVDTEAEMRAPLLILVIDLVVVLLTPRTDQLTDQMAMVNTKTIR